MIQINIYHTKDCDPKKCTAHTLVNQGLAKFVKFVPRHSVVLYPTGDKSLSYEDRELANKYGMTLIDCSWEKIDEVDRIVKSTKANLRSLPYLIPINPINYGKPTKLSTVEALGAALYIAGFREQAKEYLSKFKWGPQFIILNENLLEAYSQTKDSKGVIEVQQEYINQTSTE